MLKLMKKTLFCLLTLFFAMCHPPQYKELSKQKQPFDWQGHRGARGLLPENTIPAFIKALDLGVTTLELDLAVSKDSQLIISHEPWLNHDICQNADNTPITKDEAEKKLIWHMNVAEVQKYDCGSRGNPRFPTQQRMRVFKPTLSEMVEEVKAYCHKKNRPLPYFNIEIKTQPDYDESRTPSVKTFAQLTLANIKRLKIYDKACIQSFDPRALEAVHQLDPKITTALLIENKGTIEANLSKISFKPSIYSPDFKLIDKTVVDYCHSKNIRIIPWTVNEVADMKNMMKLGVDGLITDYPDRIIH
jgi:glycerophosphoryl diester phosphodiesterase